MTRPPRRAGLLVAAAAAACVDLNVNTVGPTVWSAQLVAAAAYPGLGGQGAAVSQADGTSAGVELTGGTVGDQHTWGLRVGTCATPGVQIGSDALYPVLVVSDSGTAQAQTHLGAQLADGGQYHLAVRVSVTDTTRIACGDLTR